MANFDLSNLALQSVCPNNEILYDDKGLPSIMVKIPKMTLADLGIGTSTQIHPAFIVNGHEVDAVYISKFQNVVQNSRAYSLPAKDPKTNINLDTCITNCNTKGAGWHLMTRAEWALLALWCKKNNTQPLGNNNYGKDTSETNYKAIPTTFGSDEKINSVATGTGPLEWSHDRTPSGIWDMNGNLNEWVGGLRTVKGEVQILADNNAADNTKSQSASSAEWKAIDASDGSLINPNGSGTTENSVKMDFISGKVIYSTTITSRSDSQRSCSFGNITCDQTISDKAKEVLFALALLPYDTTASAYNGDYFYINNGNTERLFSCGGYCASGANAGVFYTFSNNARSNANAIIGFRAAFVELPTT